MLKTIHDMKEILATSAEGCLAMANDGQLHLSFGQLYFTFTREELVGFIRFLTHMKQQMQATHGFNKIFFETGICNMRIALTCKETDHLIDLMNEAELALSLKELLAS
jgi:hypothetical protein